jgi:hypothetical protein
MNLTQRLVRILGIVAGLLLYGSCSSNNKVIPSSVNDPATVADCQEKSASTLCGYCANTGLCPYTCNFSDLCTNLTCKAGSSTGGNTNAGTSNGSSTSGGSSKGATSNCTCPGNLQCSQKVGCLQSCTCYYTINGSDGNSAWYLVGSGPAGTGACYMCAQNGLSANCNAAADAAANAVTALISSGQCL